MKRINSAHEKSRFSGNLRHYHRTGAQAPRTWDDWVEGAAGKSRRVRNWPKIIGIGLGVLVLTGIVAGLVIGLG